MASGPQLLKLGAIAQRVHGAPEAGVTPGPEFAAVGQFSQGLEFPDGLIPVDQIQHGRIEHEEARIDPVAITITGRLLGKPRHHIAVHRGGAIPKAQAAVAAWGLHGGNRGETTVAVVIGDQGTDVDIADAIAVGEAERLPAKVMGHPPQAATGGRGFTGVHQGDPPGFGLAAMHLHRAGGQIEAHIAAMQGVVREVLLDHIPLVATADHELVDAVMGVQLEDVPEDRPAAHFHHGLGPEMGFLRDTGAEAAGQDHGFHSANSRSPTATTWRTLSILGG